MGKRAQRTQLKPRTGKKPSAFSTLKAEIDRRRGVHQCKSLRKPCVKSRSYAPSSLCAYEAKLQASGIDSYEAVEREEFFDVAVGTSAYSKPLYPKLPVSEPKRRERTPEVPESRPKRKKQQVSPGYTSSSWAVSTRRRRTAPAEEDDTDARAPRSWDKDGDNIPDFLERLFDNSNRRAVGMGCLEKVFGGGEQSAQSAKMNKRPYFTWWVTVIQLVIFIVMMATYKIAPIGVSITKISGEVLMPSLTTQLVTKNVKDNLWIGPTQESLIHLGAKFSPCMRPDSNIDRVLAMDKAVETETACCVNNDGSGCQQTAGSKCSNVLSTWYKWSSASPGYKNRTSGTVCGQDPRYCLDVEPIKPSDWPNDITDWPVCKKSDNVTATQDNQHMTCEVIGRPCCVGIQGECIVTTREYCDFRSGYFHDDAALCSQVKCMGEICGLIPFSKEDRPDQFYRFLTSLFLHSGILTMIISLIFQLLLMRELECRIGWISMGLIYLGGGMVGGLASVTFIPYYVETGPSGSQLAVLGALFVDVMRWNTDERTDKPGAAIGKIIGFSLLLFVVGLFLVDFNNWSNFFGLFYGICIALAFRPIKKLRGRDVKKSSWVATHVVCALLAVAVLVILIVLFYVIPITSCEGCLYFNCIPFTPTYCDGMSVSISRNASAL